MKVSKNIGEVSVSGEMVYVPDKTIIEMKSRSLKSQREKRMLETIAHLNSIKQNVSTFKQSNRNQNEDYD